jgi:hypothetical protein
MKNIFILICIFFCLPVFAQNKSDLGVSVGTSYYMGDINPSRLFYSPKFNAGIIYRYNLNTRYVLKGELNYVALSGNDKDFSDPYQQSRNATFNSELYDITTQFEFNFLPLVFNERKMSFSPFVSTGLAAALTLNSSSKKTFEFVFPFALGVRVTVGKKWSTGLQWSFRKTFNDTNIDGIDNSPLPPSMKSYLINNDWYSFAGIFLTYKIFDFGIPCPAYESKF